MQKAGRATHAEKMTGFPLAPPGMSIGSTTFAPRVKTDAGLREIHNEPAWESLAASSQEQELAVAPRKFVPPHDCRCDRKNYRCVRSRAWSSLKKEECICVKYSYTRSIVSAALTWSCNLYRDTGRIAEPEPVESPVRAPIRHPSDHAVFLNALVRQRELRGAPQARAGNLWTCHVALHGLERNL